MPVTAQRPTMLLGEAVRAFQRESIFLSPEAPSFLGNLVPQPRLTYAANIGTQAFGLSCQCYVERNMGRLASARRRYVLRPPITVLRNNAPNISANRSELSIGDRPRRAAGQCMVDREPPVLMQAGAGARSGACGDWLLIVPQYRPVSSVQ